MEALSANAANKRTTSTESCRSSETGTRSAADSYVYYSDDDDEYSYTSSNANDDQEEVPVEEGYRFCTTAQAKQFMENTIQEASDLLCIPPEAAVILLRKYKWDGKRLTDEYFSGNKEILVECGVVHRCSGGDLQGKKSTGSCAICMDEDLELFSMDCGHEFCKKCWNAYIAEAVSQGPKCVFTQCPYPKCTEIVTKQEVSKLASGVLDKFEEYQLRSYIQSNWKMRWCPGPSCDCVAVGSSADGLVGEGQCQCGTRFCLQCGDIQHTPATCNMMVLWKEKCQDESETANWMLAMTKKCPKCSTRINKNGGCNHMTCSQCSFHFCWLCMQDWQIHGYERSCNTFELEQAKEKDSKRADAERELERYLHCYNRFQNHSQGQEFAKGELEKFEQKQEENEESDSSFDWNALKDALSQLVECRRVLKYTYVVTYCLVDRPLQRELFEDQQGLLERFTEKLSEISEKDHREIDHAQLVNLTRIVDKYTKSVMVCEID